MFSEKSANSNLVSSDNLFESGYQSVSSSSSVSDFDFFSFLFENDFKAVFPELFLIMCIVLVLLYGVFYSTSMGSGYALLLGSLTRVALLSLVFTLFGLVFRNIDSAELFYNTLSCNDFTLSFSVLLILGVCLSLIISLNSLKKFNAFEYIVLVLLSTVSMIFLISAADFITMYLAIELQSLCFYVMAAFKRNSEFATEAGLKYFLLGAFSSGILLLGISLLYGFTGITNFSELQSVFVIPVDQYSSSISGSSSLIACQLGIIFILVGFLFKLTAVPFHMWAPDVYEGVSTPVTAFFSIAPKIALFAIVIKLFSDTLFDVMIPWQKICILSSVCSMIYASFAAMSQIKIKRLLAFSSIGHVGYLLIGVCCGTTEGLQALFIYLVVYIIMTVTIFAIVLSPVKREAHLSLLPTKQIIYTTDLLMLSKTNAILAVTFTVTLFSIAGIPPLAGFYSKAFLFFAAMSSSMYLLAIVGVITSVISCFYYIRLVKIMYFEKTGKNISFAEIPKENAIILGICFLFLVFFMLFPTPLYVISHKFALSACC